MKKYFCLFLLICLSNQNFGFENETVNLKFQINKPYCLIHFLQTLNHEVESPTLLQFYYESVYYKSEKIKKLLQEYNSLKLNTGYNFPGYPKNRHDLYTTIKDLFIIYSAQSESILEFKRLTAGIAPIAEQQKLIYILKKIEPIYDEIVWNKSTHNLKKHIQMLPVLSKKYFLYEKIKNIQSFYNTVWDPEIPIIASYYPIPAKDGNPSSTIKGNTLLCGILTDTYDYDFTISVTFHEMSHMLFREQSPEFQHKIDQYYLQASLKHKMFALQLLDEGLATAIGSWIHELITGQTDFSYNDYYINNYAKAIYPLLKSYIENGKSMDEYFIQESIKICEEIFPQAIYEYDNCFRDFYMLTDVDGGKRRPLIQILRKYLKSKNYRYQFETPIIHEKYIKEIAESNTTKFILITQEHNTTFQYLKDFIPELNDFKDIDTHSDFILSFLGDGGFAYIIVNLHDIDKFETMIMNMKEKQYIQLNAPIITIK